MKKSGFTLIELLAVIVILAIIALIATPIILGIINDAREKANERSVELYASAVRNAVAAYQLTNPTAPTSFSELNIEHDGEVACTTQELYADGSFYLDGCKVNNGDKEYSYGTKQGTEKACTLDDKDGNGVASLSDMITCGTESFYVMYNENNEITMLSEYNLDVGYIIDLTEWDFPETGVEILNPTKIQNERAKGYLDGKIDVYGILKFSYVSYWRDSANETYLIDSDYETEGKIKPYVYGDYKDANGDYKNNLYLHVLEYESYLKQNGVVSATASLISYEQAVDLKENQGNPDWLHTTSYWTGSADGMDVLAVNEGRIDIAGTNACGYEDPNFDLGCNRVHGIRPVITISVDEI